MQSIQNVALDKLRFGHEFKGGSLNVRQSGRDDVDALIASIKAEGLLQPLASWEREGVFYILDGNRRLAALKKIGKPVPENWLHVIEADSIEDAQAKSLAANIMAVPLDPVDRFEAFASLQPKFTAEQIAARYGTTKKLVERSLILAKLSPTIRTALRKNELDYEAACAFTIEPDPKRQEAIFKKLKARGNWCLRRYDIREAITGDQDDIAGMLKFVGAAAAKEAGVTEVDDLFAEKGDAPKVVQNVGALEKLVQAKISSTKSKLLAEGWGSVVMEDSLEYGWERWARSPAAKGADRKKLMVVLELKGGVLKQHLGLHKSKQRVAVEQKAEKKKASPNALSNALKERLEYVLIKATRTAILNESWKDPRAAIFTAIVAADIDRHRFIQQMPTYLGSKLASIRDSISADVMKAALLKHFDPKDYFPRAPKGVVLKAIAESLVQAPADLKTKTKAVIWKFAIAHVGKTEWLPPELRTAHYAAKKGAKKR